MPQDRAVPDAGQQATSVLHKEVDQPWQDMLATADLLHLVTSFHRLRVIFKLAADSERQHCMSDHQVMLPRFSLQLQGLVWNEGRDPCGKILQLML